MMIYPIINKINFIKYVYIIMFYKTPYTMILILIPSIKVIPICSKLINLKFFLNIKNCIKTHDEFTIIAIVPIFILLKFEIVTFKQSHDPTPISKKIRREEAMESDIIENISRAYFLI